MKINGIAHTVLNVSDPARSIPFYRELFTFLEFTQVWAAKNGGYWVGGRTAVAIMPASDEYRAQPFNQGRVGLHHLCFRAYDRAGVDEFYAFLKKAGTKVIHPPAEGNWAPGYYSVLFEDPDGIRLEMNHVPGPGLLGDAKFQPTGYEGI